MISAPAGIRIWLVAGVTDMRKGFDGLSSLVQTQIRRDPFGGQLFVFRNRRGDRLKVLWWDGDGLCLYAKRLERGHFVSPRAESGCDSAVVRNGSMPRSRNYNWPSIRSPRPKRRPSRRSRNTRILQRGANPRGGQCRHTFPEMYSTTTRGANARTAVAHSNRWSKTSPRSSITCRGASRSSARCARS